LVVLSPIPQEDLGLPFPEPAAHNRALEQYTKVLQETAAQRHLPFVDLFHPLAKLPPSTPDRRWTTNGLLPNRYGYCLIAQEIERHPLGPPEPWRAELDIGAKVLRQSEAKVQGVNVEGGHLHFEIVPAHLPEPPPPKFINANDPFVRITGLASGSYVL